MGAVGASGLLGHPGFDTLTSQVRRKTRKPPAGRSSCVAGCTDSSGRVRNGRGARCRRGCAELWATRARVDRDRGDREARAALPWVSWKSSGRPPQSGHAAVFTGATANSSTPQCSGSLAPGRGEWLGSRGRCSGCASMYRPRWCASTWIKIPGCSWWSELGGRADRADLRPFFGLPQLVALSLILHCPWFVVRGTRSTDLWHALPPLIARRALPNDWAVCCRSEPGESSLDQVCAVGRTDLLGGADPFKGRSVALSVRHISRNPLGFP